MEVSRRFLAVLAATLLVAAMGLISAVSATTNYGNGWVADPGQSFTYEASVQAPINPDGTSTFKSKGGGVIPIKFALSEGTGALIFESTSAHAYSNVVYTPAVSMTVSDITNLSAVYDFTVGDCQAGSLRWSIGTPSGQIHVYFYNPNSPTSPVCTEANNRSGANLLDLGGNVEAQWPGRVTQLYDSWENVIAAYGDLAVNWLGVIVDSGPPDEVVNLTSATFTTAAGATTFTPEPASPLTSVCPSDEAAITVTKVDSGTSGTVNEATSIQPSDNDGFFRVVDCKYMYNLATTSLRGPGTYHVSATINGTTFDVADFDLK